MAASELNAVYFSSTPITSTSDALYSLARQISNPATSFAATAGLYDQAVALITAFETYNGYSGSVDAAYAAAARAHSARQAARA